jgi:short-subunit dehydrogenase
MLPSVAVPIGRQYRRPMANDRTALVTGASSGIGEAFASQLAARGHRLVVVARDLGRLERVAHELERAHHVDIEVLAADLRVPEELARVEARVAAGERPVDVLINNAGHGSRGPFHELELSAESGQIGLNVTAVVRLTHAALAAMVPRRAGAILNVSSAAGFQPAPFNAVYAATKAFVTSFTQAIHEEVAAQGIKVSCLCPGFTRTGFQQAASVNADWLPSFAWSTAEGVASAGLAALDRNQAMSVPGWPNKLAARLLPLLPRGLVRWGAAQVTGRL